VEPSDLKDHGVRRYSKFVHKVCQVGVKGLEVDWAFLEQFSTVRNCIVHTNGNKSRLAEPKALDKVVAAYPSELSFNHSVKLVVSDAFVKRCIEQTELAALAVIRFMIKHCNDAMQRTGEAGR
jgi:hypothetical protein